MPEYRWSVLCERAEISPDSNNLTIHTVIDEVQVNGITAELLAVGTVLPLPVQFLSVWRRTDLVVPERITSRLSFFNDANLELGHSQDVTVNLHDHVQTRTIATLPGLLVQGSLGVYRIHVQWRLEGGDWETVDRVPVHIMPFGVPSNPPGPAAAPVRTT